MYPTSLFDCFLKFLKRRHPGDGVDEFFERGTLLAQGADGWADRIFPGCTTGAICIGSMKSKICLIELAKQVSIFPEDLSTRLHIGFGFFDFALCQQFIGSD